MNTEKGIAMTEEKKIADEDDLFSLLIFEDDYQEDEESQTSKDTE